MFESIYDFAKSVFRSNPEQYAESTAVAFDAWLPTAEGVFSAKTIEQAVVEFDKMQPYCKEFCAPEVYDRLEGRYWLHLLPQPDPEETDVTEEVVEAVVESSLLGSAWDYAKENPVTATLATVAGLITVSGVGYAISRLLGKNDDESSGNLDLDAFSDVESPATTTTAVKEKVDSVAATREAVLEPTPVPVLVAARVEEQSVVADDVVFKKADIKQVMGWLRQYLQGRGVQHTAAQIMGDLEVSEDVAKSLVNLRDSEFGEFNFFYKNAARYNLLSSREDYQNSFIGVFGADYMRRGYKNSFEISTALFEDIKDCAIGERSVHHEATKVRHV